MVGLFLCFYNRKATWAEFILSAVLQETNTTIYIYIYIFIDSIGIYTGILKQKIIIILGIFLIFLYKHNRNVILYSIVSSQLTQNVTGEILTAGHQYIHFKKLRR